MVKQIGPWILIVSIIFEIIKYLFHLPLFTVKSIILTIGLILLIICHTSSLDIFF